MYSFFSKVYSLLAGLRQHGNDQLAFEHANWSLIESAQERFDEQLATLLQHDYHGPKLNAMLEDWAQVGMYVRIIIPFVCIYGFTRTGFKAKTQVTGFGNQDEFAMVLD